MNIKSKRLITYAVGIGILLGAIYVMSGYIDRKILETPIVATVLPDLGPEYANGKSLYEANCSGCHGVSLGGKKELGPPFIHNYYTPSHHSDIAFYRAISQGVVAHHWQFGNMPAVVGLSEDNASEVIAYIRAVQRADSIN